MFSSTRPAYSPIVLRTPHMTGPRRSSRVGTPRGWPRARARAARSKKVYQRLVRLLAGPNARLSLLFAENVGEREMLLRLRERYDASSAATPMAAPSPARKPLRKARRRCASCAATDASPPARPIVRVVAGIGTSFCRPRRDARAPHPGSKIASRSLTCWTSPSYCLRVAAAPESANVPFVGIAWPLTTFVASPLTPGPRSGSQAPSAVTPHRPKKQSTV